MAQEQTQKSMETPPPRGQEVAAEAAPLAALKKPHYYNEAIRRAPTVGEAFTAAAQEGQNLVAHTDALLLQRKIDLATVEMQKTLG